MKKFWALLNEKKSPKNLKKKSKKMEKIAKIMENPKITMFSEINTVCTPTSHI